MADETFDVNKAHRWFAIECNNQAWDLVEVKERTAEQIEEMIHLAHAARFHWKEVGTALNLLRGETLLSTAYGVANRPENAMAYAELASSRVKKTEGVTEFDRASISGAYAKACRVAGNAAKAAELEVQFDHELAQVEEQADRDLLRQLYSAS